MRKSNNFKTFVNAKSRESCFGMFAFYIGFAGFGQCHEEKISAVSASFKEIY